MSKKPRCNKCGRPLTSAASIAAGVGPICGGGGRGRGRRRSFRGGQGRMLGGSYSNGSTGSGGALPVVGDGFAPPRKNGEIFVIIDDERIKVKISIVAVDGMFFVPGSPGAEAYPADDVSYFKLVGSRWMNHKTKRFFSFVFMAHKFPAELLAIGFFEKVEAHPVSIETGA